MPYSYYAVKKGVNPGIYGSWPECSQQTQGFKGALYKGFNTFEDAQKFISGENVTVEKMMEKSQQLLYDSDKIIYVDGGFNRHTGKEAWGSVVNGYGSDLIPYAYHQNLLTDMEIKEVSLPKGKRWIMIAKFEGVYHQNNGAELLSLIVGLRLAIFLNRNNFPVKIVYSDSQVVLYWSIRLKDESAATFDPRKVSYIHELIRLRREFESLGGTVDKVDGDSNPADLGYH